MPDWTSTTRCIVHGIAWTLAVGAATLAWAQDCEDPDPLATVEFGFPIGQIARIDELDAVVHTIDDPSVPLLQVRDPLTFGLVDQEPTAWIPTSIAILPWGDEFLAYTTESDLVFARRIGSDGSLAGVYSVTEYICPDDELLAKPVAHAVEHGTAAFRALYPEGLLYVGGGTGCLSYTEIVAFDLFSLTFAWIYHPPEPLEQIVRMAVDPYRNLLFAASRQGQTSLVAIDTLTGTEVWRASGSRISGLGRRADRLYTVTVNGLVTARNVADGAEVWSIAPTPTYPVVTDLIAPLEPPFHDVIITRDFLGGVHLFRDLGDSVVQEWTVPLPDAFTGPSLLDFDSGSDTIYAPDTLGNVHEIDARMGVLGEATAVDSIPSTVRSMLLTWPFDDDGNMELYATTEQGTIARLCANRGDVVRNREFGPLNRIDGYGFPSFHDTESGSTSVIVHTLDDLEGPTTLARIDVVATIDFWSTPGPCDVGRGPTPCFEDMSFRIMGWEPGIPIGGDIADPANPGKMFDLDVTDRLTLVRSYGASTIGAIGIEPALLSFDLTGLELILGRGARVAVMGVGSESTMGRFAPAGMNQGAERDTVYRYPEKPPFWTTTHAAVRIRGETDAVVGMYGSWAPPVPSWFEVGPNPFASSTSLTIRGVSGELGEVTVYDVTGRRVATLFHGRLSGTETRVEWSSSRVPPGVYFVRATAGQRVASQKVTRIR